MGIVFNDNFHYLASIHLLQNFAFPKQYLDDMSLTKNTLLTLLALQKSTVNQIIYNNN